ALFFATYTWDKNQNARLWLLDPHLCNEIFLKEYTIISPLPEKSYFDFLNSFTVSNKIYTFDHYRFNYDDFNRRIRAQSGVFTLHLNRNKLYPNTYALDKILKNEINYEKILNKSRFYANDEVVMNYIDIQTDAAKDIEQQLLIEDIIIINILPDLTGTVDYINNIFSDL